jgi:hypothetical protein
MHSANEGFVDIAGVKALPTRRSAASIGSCFHPSPAVVQAGAEAPELQDATSMLLSPTSRRWMLRSTDSCGPPSRKDVDLMDFSMYGGFGEEYVRLQPL